MKARSTIVPSRSVISYSGGVPHRNGIPMQGREGRAEAWEAKFPERGAYVLRRRASQLASVPNGRMRCQGPGDLNVEPTYTFSCPPQEGGYSASEALAS